MILNLKILNILKNKKNLIFILLIFIFLLIRIIILFNSPYLYFGSDIECYIGTIAKEIIDGPKFSFFQYQYLEHYPGFLFSGIITVPFFLIFGQSGMSLKLVSLFIALLTLIVIYLFLNKFFNHKSAVFFAVLFIFSMPFYTIHQLTSFGMHSYPLLFDAIIMFLFYCIFFDNQKNFKHFLLFGFMCGFAVWFIFQSLVMIFTCLLFWFISDKKFFLRKHFFIFLVFFLVGYSPGIYFNITHDFSGIFNTKMEAGFGDIGMSPAVVSRFTERLFDAVSRHLPDSFEFMDFGFLNKSILSYTYYSIFLFAFLIIFWLCRKSFIKIVRGIILLEKYNVDPNEIKKETFILLYPIIFLLIYSITNFEPKHVYFLALHPFILIVLSLFIVKLQNKKLKKIPILILIILLIIGFIGNISLISFNNPYNGNKIYEPHCYYFLAEMIGSRSSINSITLICNKFDLEYQKYCYIGFGIGMMETECNNYNLQCYINNNCNRLEASYRKYCYEGIGVFIYEKDKLTYEKFNTNLTDGLNVCDLFNSDYKNYCYKGFCEQISSSFGSEPQEGIERCNKMNSGCRDYCYDGLALDMEKGVREDYQIYPINASEKCIQLERQLIISRNKTICLLNLVNSSLNISSNQILN